MTSATRILPSEPSACLTAASSKRPRKPESGSDFKEEYKHAFLSSRCSLRSPHVGQESGSNSRGDFHPGTRDRCEHGYVQSLEYLSAQTGFVSRSGPPGNGSESCPGPARPGLERRISG